MKAPLRASPKTAGAHLPRGEMHITKLPPPRPVDESREQPLDPHCISGSVTSCLLRLLGLLQSLLADCFLSLSMNPSVSDYAGHECPKFLESALAGIILVP